MCLYSCVQGLLASSARGVDAQIPCRLIFFTLVPVSFLRLECRHTSFLDSSHRSKPSPSSFRQQDSHENLFRLARVFCDGKGSSHLCFFVAI